jgi:hypothetical protein
MAMGRALRAVIQTPTPSPPSRAGTRYGRGGWIPPKEKRLKAMELDIESGRDSRIVVRWQDPTMTWWVCRIIRRPRQADMDDLLVHGRTQVEIALALLDDRGK